MKQNTFLQKLSIGTTIEVITEINDDVVHLKTNIANFNIDEGTFDIYNPLYQKRLYNMSLMTSYEFKYKTAESGVYSFTGEVIDKKKERSVRMVTIKYKGGIKKIQRRNFFRLSLVKEINVKLPSDEEYFESDELIKFEKKIAFQRKKVLSKDISAGGIGFFSNKIIKKGYYLIVEFNLGIDRLKLLGKVVRISSSDRVNAKYIIGVQFIHMGVDQRKKIINYIFKKQRELRKKGLM